MAALLHLEPFNAPFQVTTCPKERNKRLMAAGYMPDKSAPRGAVYRLDNTEGDVAFMVYLPKERDEAVLYHEATHLAMGMMTHHGVPVSEFNQEIICYLQEHAARLMDAACYAQGNRTSTKRGVK